MKVNLLISPYYEQRPERRAELEICMNNNLKAGFDKIICLVEIQDTEYTRNFFKDHSNVIIELCGQRATFNDYFYFSNIHADNDTISGVCNLDIFTTVEELAKIRSISWAINIALTLSRWDLKGDLTVGQAEHFGRRDSQDAFLWRGKSWITNAPYTLGVPGIDNRMCSVFQENRYVIFNASNDLKFYHYHISKVCNYRNEAGDVINTYPQPYAFVEPCSISNIP